LINNNRNILRPPERDFLQGFRGIRGEALPVREIPSYGKVLWGRENSQVLRL
jgi:hypothetical protein